jgi:hypothetical protein
MTLQNRKLGCRPPKKDKRTLMLATYMTESLPAPPPSVDWTKGITEWGMMLNDVHGDCTIAGVAHATQVFTANTTGITTIPDATVLSYYQQWDGYNPSDPSTDAGGVELDVLNLWRQQGFSGHSLIAYCDVDPANQVHVKQAISLFGGLYIGLQLPISAQNQDVWDVVENDGGVWGGHCVFVPKYDENGLTCITWGELKVMTWAFWSKYCLEAHALLDKDWLGSMSQDPAGLNLQALQADLTLVTS